MGGTTEKAQTAQERLKDALAERGAAARLASELGIDPSLVTRWVQGQRRPNTAQRVHIEQEFGIPILDWDLEGDSPSGGAAA